MVFSVCMCVPFLFIYKLHYTLSAKTRSAFYVIPTPPPLNIHSYTNMICKYKIEFELKSKGNLSEMMCKYMRNGGKMGWQEEAQIYRHRDIGAGFCVKVHVLYVLLE